MTSFIDNSPLIAFLLSTSLAIAALLACVWLGLSVRRLRAGQKVVLGDTKDDDIIAHATAVQHRVDGLAYEIRKLEERLESEGRRMSDCLTFRSMMRYDAYRDLSGMQSSSLCLLDAQFSGVIISSIQGRDHARIYVRDIRHGESREKLSPEEEQVLREAMGLESRRPRAAGGGASA